MTVQADRSGIDEDAVSAVLPEAVIYMPFAELVDLDKEIERLTKEEEKLKKELVDRKIPSSYRQEILLVCDNNHVLWACGVRRSESCLVDDTTSRVLEILINVKERN